MNNKFHGIASALFCAFAASSPGAATTTYSNSVNAFISDYAHNKALFVGLGNTEDGSPATSAGYVSDGFASAQASKLNNGTAIVTSAGQSLAYFSAASASFLTTFDFSPSTKGRITLKLTGWAIATGSGVANVSTEIRQNGVDVAFTSVYSAGFSAPGQAIKLGLQKLSLVKTLNWQG